MPGVASSGSSDLVSKWVRPSVMFAWSVRARRIALTLALSGLATVTHGQDRANQNVVTEAEDAFGLNVGRESIGIYNSQDVRGFSPIAAGNVRIDGLYFDPVAQFSNPAGIPSTLLDSVSIKVGLSAQGYPFAA